MKFAAIAFTSLLLADDLKPSPVTLEQRLGLQKLYAKAALVDANAERLKAQYRELIEEIRAAAGRMKQACETSGGVFVQDKNDGDVKCDAKVAEPEKK